MRKSTVLSLLNQAVNMLKEEREKLQYTNPELMPAINVRIKNVETMHQTVYAKSNKEVESFFVQVEDEAPKLNQQRLF